MTPLPLSQMPSPRVADTDAAALRCPDGFVDDHVVLAIAAGPVLQRETAVPGDLALAADECDFAGWNLAPPPQPEKRTRISQPIHQPVAADRRAEPPALAEPGIGPPHHGDHRWWVAGLAGAFSTALFTTLLLTLSSRSIPLAEETIFAAPRPSAAQEPAAPAKNGRKTLDQADLAHGR